MPADPWIRKELSCRGEGGIADCPRARFPLCGAAVDRGRPSRSETLRGVLCRELQARAAGAKGESTGPLY